ncbi:hypothetical protein [Chitinophaga japonensis]|uniref:Uncharacterized protein n=1 Tax=Chitinophaga japonensis TaxID=104662 RepID=A0A562SMM4_CHIJA|nr:hypothetical protein [Chitinophaga japonensis]TWI82502.1 hypothetical protein LX66_5075 [Chitinophaga japonensis]
MRKPVLILISTCIALFPGCSEDNDTPQPPASDCRIITMVQDRGGDATTYDISYNSEGKISSIQLDDNNKSLYTLNYTGNTFIHELHYSSRRFSHTLVELNDQGLPLKITEELYNDILQPNKITNRNYTTYEYNSRGELLKYKAWYDNLSNPDAGIEITTLVTWSGGNAVKAAVSDGSEWLELEYYTDRPWQPGDEINRLFLIQQGICPYKNKNLVKAQKYVKKNNDGTTSVIQITNINYEFDGEGKITSATSTTSTIPGKIVTQYQYACN